jgi:hypothetical protein
MHARVKDMRSGALAELERLPHGSRRDKDALRETGPTPDGWDFDRQVGGSGAHPAILNNYTPPGIPETRPWHDCVWG